MCGSLTHTTHILHKLLLGTLGGMLLSARNILRRDILLLDGHPYIRRLVNDLSNL